jgi:hypothetical protein
VTARLTQYEQRKTRTRLSLHCCRLSSGCAACWPLSVGCRPHCCCYDSSVCVTQFQSPNGKVKAVIQLKGYNNVWGRTVSQDGRYVPVARKPAGAARSQLTCTSTDADGIVHVIDTGIHCKRLQILQLDRRYAAIGCSYIPPTGGKVPLEIVLLQLNGASPKVSD